MGARVIVCGPPGAGKVDFARLFAHPAEVVDLQELYWDEHFKSVPDQTFRSRVFRRIGDGTRWVVVGNHRQRLGEVWEQADTIVWLDLPLEVCQARIQARELARRGSGIESILGWLPAYWQRLRADYETLRARYPGASVIRLRETPANVRALRAGV